MSDGGESRTLLVPRPIRNRRAGCIVAAVLAAVTLMTHGGSLFDGLFFDDYWHRATLRDYGWDWNDLIESATFELPGRLANLWWLEQPLQWRYARPVAMFFMKLEYLAAGGNPISVHAFALTWHWLCAMLVYQIALWAFSAAMPRRDESAGAGETALRGWALIAAILFILHPQSVFAVGWTAARNALVSAFFFFAALKLYARASFVGRRPADPISLGGVALAMLSWLLALFSRETAIVFPLLLPILDASFGGPGLLRRRAPVYAAFGVALVAYLVWRLVIFPTGGPPGIYFTAPRGLDYAAWAASKLLHMLFAHIVHTPMFLGLATYSGMTGGKLLEHAVMFAMVAGIVAMFLFATRGVRGRWIWPAWAVLAFIPVIPVFVMPHFAYLPAAATAIMIPLLLFRLRGAWRIIALTFVIGYAAWPLAIYRYAWRGIVRSEQVIYAAIAAEVRLAPDAEVRSATRESRNTADPPSPARAASASDAAGAPHLFFLNLPAAGIYATVAMREAWQRHDLEGDVLTFSPHPLMMTAESTITQLNAHSFKVETPAPGYFSGMGGQMLRDGMRPGAPLTTGTTVSTARFQATVLVADDRGITSILFTFPKPLHSPDYIFIVSTPAFPAARVIFHDESAAFPAVIAVSEQRQPVGIAALLRERAAYFQIIDTVKRIVRSDLYLTGE